jgi:hypothetical protein
LDNFKYFELNFNIKIFRIIICHPRNRHSSGNIFEPSAELPDDGELFTLRDILADAERQVELKPNSGPVLVSAPLLPLMNVDERKS